MAAPRFLPLEGYTPATDAALRERAAEIRAEICRRRSVRDFSPRPVERALMLDCVAAAASAPSGANLQPWHFVLVSDPEIKRRIRFAAEAEEREFYGGRAPAAWVETLTQLGTTAEKPFLEIAPWLVAIFAESYGVGDDGERRKHYYVQESVGIATGLLIAALHHAGLATLTHTPSPMGFLSSILERPANQRPFLLLVVGHPAASATVPDITRKPLDEVASFR